MTSNHSDPQTYPDNVVTLRDSSTSHEPFVIEDQDPETQRIVAAQLAARARNYAPLPREDIRP